MVYESDWKNILTRKNLHGFEPKKHDELYLASSAHESEWEKNRDAFPEDVRSIAKNITDPPNANLLLHNDNLTPMDYVVSILIGLFEYEPTKAQEKMLQVHESGFAVIAYGISSISAEHLVKYLTGHANSRGYPLKWESKNA